VRESYRFLPCPWCGALRPAELEYCVECFENLLRAKKPPRNALRYREWKRTADKKLLLLSLLSPRLPPPIPYRHRAISFRDGSKYLVAEGGRLVYIGRILRTPEQRVLLPLVREEGRERPRGKDRPLFKKYDFAPGWGLVETRDRRLMERGYAITYAKLWTMSNKALRAKLIAEAL